MGGIQSFLAIGAMVLFSLSSIRFNSSVLENISVEVENKVYLTAFSLADDLIEEIKQKAFDENTVDFQALKVTQLSGTLGPDGETHSDYDDIDDFNGYSKPISLPHAEGYKVTCEVKYVNSDGTSAGSKSFYKLVTVTVTSDYLRSPLFISFIFSLHAKN